MSGGRRFSEGVPMQMQLVDTALLAGIVLALVVWWLVEYARHQRNLAKIPVRVHINGSRGKSSVTRLIGGALREAGKVVVTKTTGTNARFIYPDGREEPIIRIGPANIKEQRMVVRRAAELGAEILVTECMAIDPELQWVLQKKYIKGTVGVITNVRADHLDVMGPTVRDAADALSAVMPEGGICFTAEAERFEWLEENAKKLNCKLVLARPETITDEEMKKFSYIEHKENVALALAVAEYLGVDRQTALRGMWKANPDPGVLRIFTVFRGDARIRFANAFAANDPESTYKIWRMLSDYADADEVRVVVANSRADRIQRAEQLGELMGQLDAALFILVGANLSAVADRMTDAGVPKDKIVYIPEGDPQKIVDEVLSRGWDRVMIVGIGNIGGVGHKIADFFEDHDGGKI